MGRYRVELSAERSVQPLVKQAIEQSVSEMVVSGLSAVSTPRIQIVTQNPSTPTTIPDVIINPDDMNEVNSENQKIITTKVEKTIFSVVKDILDLPEELFPKDTESYYCVLFQNKSNRWILRYYGDKKRPHIQVIVELSESRIAEISRAGLTVQGNNQIFVEKPEDLYRISGILFDCLEYCKNDENFKKATATEP